MKIRALKRERDFLLSFKKGEPTYCKGVIYELQCSIDNFEKELKEVIYKN